ncbi:recombinase family protein [Paenibacillus sp. GCM10027627]|uniref:recombinase family protein n=1 Tax=unclassified Paenibacillus TaxID=185978 RepID=UPI00362D096E
MFKIINDTNTNQTIKAVAYCRVSTGSEEQETSYKNQQSYFQREISMKEGFSLYRIYADRGISGTSLNRREEFSLMLYDAGLDETKISPKKSVFVASRREPVFNCIFVKNTSRFARNVLVIDILRELLKKNVFVYFLDINLVFDSIEKEFMLNLFLNFSQQESIDKSAKVRFGQEESARKGVIQTTKNIYGYRYSTDTKQLTIIEEEAKIVRKVFNLYAKGFGIRLILEKLSEEGVKSRKGKDFVPSFIKRMLDQEKYYGTLVRNKYETGAIFNKKTPTVKDKSLWFVHENRVPAIISKKLFDQCKEIRASKINHINQKGIYRGQSEFAGKIYCGKCGSVYTRNIDVERAFYNCSLKKQKGTSACSNINVQEETLYKHIDDIAENGLIAVFVSQKEKQIAEFKNQINKLLNRIDSPSEEEVKIKNLEMASLNNEESRLMQLFVKGTYNEMQLDEMKLDIDERREVLQNEISELSKTNEDVFKLINETEKKISKISSMSLKSKYSREEIIELISRFTVSEKTVEFITKKDKRKSSRLESIVTYEFALFNNLFYK